MNNNIAKPEQEIGGPVTLPGVFIRINHRAGNPDGTATDNPAMAIGG